MNAVDQIYFALERFQRLPAETNFERVERNRREAKEANAEYRGPDSDTTTSEEDVS